MDVTVRLQKTGGAHHDFTAMLEALPCGALLIDGRQRIVFANATACTLLDPAAMGILTCVSGRVAVRDPATDRRFQAALSAALGLGTRVHGGRVSMQHPSGEGRLTITVAPIPSPESIWNALEDDTFGRAQCMVLISTPNVAKLAQQYRLTPAEARVASAIATGKGLTAASRGLGIARSTAQSHLDKIFQKTGTNRQAELVGLVQAGFGF